MLSLPKNHASLRRFRRKLGRLQAAATALVLGGLLSGCAKRSSGAALGPAGKAAVSQVLAAENAERLPAQEFTWIFESPELGRMPVVVLVPERARSQRFPVLVTFHGRGESAKGPDRGARGWVDDYWLPQASARLFSQQPLTVADFQGFADPARLARFNGGLAREPYEGLVIACPYTPDILRGDDPFPRADGIARFVVERLLPRLRQEMPVIPEASATGIDGVSLGGRTAISVGLLRPTEFGAVAGLQSAFDSESAPLLASRAGRALSQNPQLKLRLLTSSADFFLPAHRVISQALNAAKVPHELVVIPGRHDYEFNRGPGAHEMLIYHDRVLRGRSAW